ncbi:MAG: MipA/OmpV family protein [Gammaproteobacteria bacterium]
MKKINEEMLLTLISMMSFWMIVSSAQAEEVSKEPLWEIGVAGGVLSTPHYMGSDQRYTLPIAAPYFVYRGKHVKANRQGVKGLLIDQGNFSLDLGLGFGLPVNNKNKAREGMPDLSLTGQLGPQLNWIFPTSKNQPKFSLHMPVRYVLDVEWKKLGWIAEPLLLIEQRLPVIQQKVLMRLHFSSLLAGKSFNKYYYGVADRHAKSDRPAYEAKSGFHSYSVKLSSTYSRSKYLSFSGFMQLRELSHGVIDNSPLVRQSADISLGIGFVWSARQSVVLAGQSQEPVF